MELKKIKLNPDNPRIIKDKRFNHLVKSIKEFPKMMALRPIIIDDNNVILGGNMRYMALQKLKYTEIPDEWVKKASDLTEEEKKRFIITDNNEFGENDWDILMNSWNIEDLASWGMELPSSLGSDLPDYLLGNELKTNEDQQSEKKLSAILVVAYDNLNDLDRLTDLYQLERVEITPEIKNNINNQNHMYVFKK